MAVNKGETNVITTADNDRVLSIDFIEQFNGSLSKILEVIGATNLRPVPAGSTIKIYKTTLTEPEDTREEGGVIPLTKVETKLAKTETIDIRYARKATTGEEIQKVGFDRAVSDTDAKLLRSEQSKIRNELMASLAEGTGAASGENFQKALANAWAQTVNAFDDEDEVSVVAFANPVDVAEYLGNANVTVQEVFGMQYLTGFVGVTGVFLSSRVPQGTLYTTAVDNIKMYYVDVNGDLGTALGYTADESGYVGVKHYAGNERATYETGTVVGVKFITENLSGVVVSTIGDDSE